MASACSANAAARASSPDPSARLIAEDTPPPIAPADSICISMTIGNTRAMAASSHRAEDADVDGLGDRHGGDHQHCREVGQRQPHERRQNWRAQQRIGDPGPRLLAGDHVSHPDTLLVSSPALVAT